MLAAHFQALSPVGDALLDVWKLFSAYNPHFHPNSCTLDPDSHSPNWAAHFSPQKEPRISHTTCLSPTEIRNTPYLFIEDHSSNSHIPLSSTTPSHFLHTPPHSQTPHITPSTTIILFRNDTFSLLELINPDSPTIGQLHSILSHYTGGKKPLNPLPFDITPSPFTELLIYSTPLTNLHNIPSQLSDLLHQITHLPPTKLFTTPPFISSTTFKLTIKSPLEDSDSPNEFFEDSFNFINEDYGQFFTFNGTKHGNCCYLLCLAIIANIDPYTLALYLLSRKILLQESNTFMTTHQQSQSIWTSLIPFFNHLAASFPESNEWAGTFNLGNIVDIQHTALLSPSEIRHTPLLFIHDSSRDNHALINNRDGINEFAYFPAIFSSTQKPNPPHIILHQNNHFTILRPTQPNTFHLLTAYLRSPSHLNYLTQHNTFPQPPFSKLIALHTPCSRLGQLFTEHDSLLRASSKKLDWRIPSLPTSQESLVVDNSNNPPANTPSPITGSKRNNRHDKSTPENSQQLSRSKPSISPANAIDSMSLDDSQPVAHSTHSAPSITSSTDLGNYVDMMGSRKESKYRSRIGVRGFASADESSEEDSCSYSSHSPSSSEVPSLYSTGSFHHHPVPSRFNLPICPKCRRPAQFGQFHSDNHNCDRPDCIHGVEIFQTGCFAFHCANCDFDICISCHPINWVPESSLTQSLASDPSCFPPSQLLMPNDHLHSSQPHGDQISFSTPDDLESPFRQLSIPVAFTIPQCPKCTQPLLHVLFQTSTFHCHGRENLHVF
jgi:hypothetical protein